MQQSSLETSQDLKGNAMDAWKMGDEKTNLYVLKCICIYYMLYAFLKAEAAKVCGK